MFEGKSLLDILQIGGLTLYILLLCSLASIAVFLERVAYYRKQSKISKSDFMDRLSEMIGRKDMESADEIVTNTSAPYSRVIRAGLKTFRSGKACGGAMERAIAAETRKLERLTGIVGTIGNIGVYIGLLGTVLGIVRAFHDIAASGAGGMNTVIEGVAEALVCTAAGLLVAIPAVMFFNYFTRRIDIFIDDMEACASELIELLEGK